MVFRVPHAAPQSQLPVARRGRVVGHFCLVCATIYPLHRSRHSGKPMYGRDHIASTCTHEGDLFAPGEPWWEPAVEVLPAPDPAPAAAAAGAPAAAAPPPPAGPPPPAKG
ncbi:MAG TPA: hypothetical protein VHR45_03885 [Thermoanaerobaculia bacterium]|nr:hypothetical protein [Thermoanaerobaculia bacterium]